MMAVHEPAKTRVDVAKIGWDENMKYWFEGKQICKYADKYIPIEIS